MKRSRAGLAIAAATTVLVVGCYAPAEVTPQGPTHGSHTQVDTAETPLREGERFVDVGLPEAYSPKAPTTGTDDYRCFLLDPKLDRDAFVTGIDVAPDRPDLVHHVILSGFRRRALRPRRATTMPSPARAGPALVGQGSTGPARVSTTHHGWEPGRRAVASG